MSAIGKGTTGTILQGNGTGSAPKYSTATYPSTAGTSGKVLISDGTNIVSSTPTFPNASATSGKFIRSDGTNWIASTPTLPTTAGTASTLLRSDGTNFVNTTATYPTTAGTSGNVISSDGTNFSSSTFTLNANSGSSTGITHTISASGTGSSVTTSASGSTITLTLNDASDNVILGRIAGNGSISGNSCVSVGTNTLHALTNGTLHTAIGYNSLFQVTGGTYNTCLGANAGYLNTGTDSNNVYIQSDGATGESNVLRIGNGNGTGTRQLAKAYIQGISGVTVTGTAVLCATDGQLGTVASSIRYKDNVEDMADDVSIMHLRPVEFTYKKDKTCTKQYGLIAEEVEEDFPYLCFYDNEGHPESVKYHELPVLLLKEIQRLNKRIEALEKR